MRDLLIEYIQSSKELKERIESFKLEHEEVLDAYKESKGKNKGKNQTAACPAMNELNILNNMYNEQLFIIDWLRSGHNPNEHRAIDKRTVYLVDHKVLESIIDDNHYKKVSFDEYDDYIKDANNIISHALRRLSKRELEVFLMIDCEKMSFQDVAEILGLAKGSIQKFYERAKEKIAKEVDYNLFLL